MTAEERAALIDRLAPLIIEERRKTAEQNPKRPPWYMMNIAHPVMGWLYNQYLAKLGEVSPPGGADMPPKLHEAAAAPESSHSCCVGKYGNTTVQVMHNARHRPLLQACARRPPVRFSARLFHRVPGPCVQIAKRRGCAWAGGFLWCVCSTGMAQATHAARINTGTRHQRMGG